MVGLADQAEDECLNVWETNNSRDKILAQLYWLTSSQCIHPSYTGAFHGKVNLKVIFETLKHTHTYIYIYIYIYNMVAHLQLMSLDTEDVEKKFVVLLNYL